MSSFEYHEYIRKILLNVIRYSISRIEMIVFLFFKAYIFWIIPPGTGSWGCYLSTMTMATMMMVMVMVMVGMMLVIHNDT